MNQFSVKHLAVAATMLLVPLTTHAQNADESLRQRADSITVGDYCELARQIVSLSAVNSALGADSSGVRARSEIICDDRFSNFSLLALTGGASAPIDAVARLHTRKATSRQAQVVDATVEFRADVRREGVREVVRTALGDQRNAQWVLASETVNSLLAADARDRAIARLSNYERKLGPTSARLNGAEVLINFAAQRWLPFFRATPTGGPSPLELVASYAPGYLTFDGDKTPIPVSASEFGFRWYLFGDNFGKSGFAGIFLPSYFSAGVLTASHENGAMVWPWKGRDRTGGYVSWGSIKVGYIKRDGGSWLVSKQFQAVPLVF